MARTPSAGTGPRPRSVPTPDELVVHLREAGARSVYVSRERAFRDGTVPITATYEYTNGYRDSSDDRGSTDDRGSGDHRGSGDDRNSAGGQVPNDDRRAGSSAETVHEQLGTVFDAIGDRIWFHDREWALEGVVEPAFPDPQPELIPLYDRHVERKHGDGFNLRNLLFVYEANRE